MASVYGSSDQAVMCGTLVRMLLDLRYLVEVEWIGLPYQSVWGEGKGQDDSQIAGWVKGYMIIEM